MVATGFTQQTGLGDPQFLPPQEPIQVPQGGESRRLVDETPDPGVWQPEEDERNQFAQLLTVGITTKTLDIMGHAVVIQSLTVEDDLNIGLFTKDFLGTEAYARAVQLATCAASVRTIDGRLLYVPLTTDEPQASVFANKLDKLRKYHASVIMEIYPHVLLLDKEFADLAIKLGKLKG